MGAFRIQRDGLRISRDELVSFRREDAVHRFRVMGDEGVDGGVAERALGGGEVDSDESRASVCECEGGAAGVPVTA